VLDERGERQHSANLLALLYAWCTEGFGTLDLKEAKSLSKSYGERDDRRRKSHCLTG
jgi:hypothetical protein